jgi:hypothetical protein
LSKGPNAADTALEGLLLLLVGFAPVAKHAYGISVLFLYLELELYVYSELEGQNDTELSPNPGRKSQIVSFKTTRY